MTGLSGDPDDFVTTPELMGRMAYASPDAWYRDARARDLAGFPRPLRRAVWRLGDVQAWAKAGGLQRLAAARGDAPPAQDAPSAPAEAPAAAAVPAEIRDNIVRFLRRA